MILKLAIKELWNQKLLLVLFVLSLGVGSLGFVATETFKNSTQKNLLLQSKNLLGADLSIESRRLLASDEWELLLKQSLDKLSYKISKLYELYSMVQFDKQSKLIQIRAIENTYPFYGELILESGKKNDPLSSFEVWVDQALKVQLELKIGSRIQMGSREFVVKDFIVKDSAMNINFMTASRVYLRYEDLDSTNLVIPQKSTFFHSYLFKFNSAINSNDLKIQWLNILKDPSIRVRTPADSSDQMGRMLTYLTDYLGLVSLVSILLSSLAVSFLFRSFLNLRLKDASIYLSLGLSSFDLQKLFILEMIIMSLLGSLPTLVLAPSILKVLDTSMQEWINIPLSSTFQFQSILFSLLLSLASGLLMGWPHLKQLKFLNPTSLFQEFYQPVQSKNKIFSWLSFLPAIIVFWGLSVYQTYSLKIGSFFVASLFVSIVLVYFSGAYILKFLNNLKIKTLEYRLAIRSAFQRKASTLTCFLTLVLGIALINLIPQIKSSLSQELERPEGSKIPSLFLFDIQEDQMESLNQLINNNGYQLYQNSPLIRARLLKINQTPFEVNYETSKILTREEEQDQRFRNRGMNLSIRSKISDSEEIIEGNAFPVHFNEDSSGPALVSVEKGFAQRLKLKLGDLLLFDIQGVEILAKIYNFRKVKWTSFQPNFFIVFQEGVLEDAPKTYLSSILNLNSNQRIHLQNQIVKTFPNISVVDITQIVNRLMGVFSQMAKVLEFMAYLSLLTGFMVLYSIIKYENYRRQKDWALLKVVGMSSRQLIKTLFSEYGVLILFSAVLGILLCLALSFGLSELFFDQLFVPDIKFILLTTFIISGLSIFMILLGLKQKSLKAWL